ncbi:MAG: glycoside hydrolase family 2, candidate beta-glycosidase [Bacteroidetes bacterium]|nr:glycoside hydrolase family 2, candidate beta-glycosidase [Bacteroidota bacterium]
MTRLPRTLLSLNGGWQIAPGRKDAPPTHWDHEVVVPGLIDLAAPRYDWSVHEYHWYRTTFAIPATNRSDLAFLRIEQAMFGTEVWLNGQRIGCDIACYTSQEYNITTAVKYDAENELLVRVGLKSTLPPESAVGKDQERSEFIPGIWGDVELVLSGNPRIKLVQVIPHIDTGIAETRFWVENHSDSDIVVDLAAHVLEKKSGIAVSTNAQRRLELKAKSESTLSLELKIDDPTLWSPEDPFLYDVKATLECEGRLTDLGSTTFGMREFKVVGGDFVLNGKKIFLRGGNIALHRFFSDADRGTLPWDLDWVKNLLIDIPKAHNFNFFRNHIGQLYNRWYDVADEHGMLLQNEWQFWTTTGSKEQITKEFTRWLQDNWNHPSIIIWDALNECSDETVQNEIVPAMKNLDPTRPWESVDFVEQHPYIYSLGPVLNDRPFGFTKSMKDIETMATPSVVNEFLWWWLDKELKPTVLTQDVIERWLGKDYTQGELVGRQSFLAQELVELFRRMRVDAIQPFVYLSNNSGPTAHWFLGHVKDLRPKPVMQTLKNAFAPFGISLELWDRHFFAGESRAMRLFIINDDPVSRTGAVRYGVVRFDGEWTYNTSLRVTVEPGGSLITPIQVMLPRRAGEYRIRAELLEEGRGSVLSYSEKIAHVFDPLTDSEAQRRSAVLVMEGSDEITRFLTAHRFPIRNLSAGQLSDADIAVVADGMVRSREYERCVNDLSRVVNAGATLVVIEPEYGVQGKEEIRILNDLVLALESRNDTNRGGYDSYVFADQRDHPLWRGIDKNHLHMFNGGLGGEMVSQHTVTCPVAYDVLARCGMKLAVEVVQEIQYGSGLVIVSRIQTRGRLNANRHGGALFDRRVDPVAQRYFLNLVSYAGRRKSGSS